MAHSEGKQINPIAGSIITILIGVVIITVGIFLWKFTVEQDNRIDEETMGTVVDVYAYTETHETGGDRKTYTYYDTTASYTVGDVDYTIKNTLGHSVSIGDKIRVYFNSKVPSDATLSKPGQLVGPIICLGMGAVAFIIGCVFLVTEMVNRKEAKAKVHKQLESK